MHFIRIAFLLADARDKGVQCMGTEICGIRLESTAGRFENRERV
jgi:hypothetical protein